MKTNREIEGKIDWDYSVITKMQSKAIDKTNLTISGGVLHNIANNMKQQRGYYSARNTKIERSNIMLHKLCHYVSEKKLLWPSLHWL